MHNLFDSSFDNISFHLQVNIKLILKDCFSFTLLLLFNSNFKGRKTNYIFRIWFERKDEVRHHTKN